MPFSPHFTIRLSAPQVLFCVIAVAVLALLIGKRLDLPFAGGEGAGTHAQATLLRATSPSFSSSLRRGETVSTDATTFAEYQVNNDCTVALAENTALLFEDGRTAQATFRFLTGRLVATGNCTFTTRETRVYTQGTATLVLYSWRDELLVKVIEGNATVSQSSTTTPMYAESSAMSFSTLPDHITQQETGFSLNQEGILSRFYAWSLSNE